MDFLLTSGLSIAVLVLSVLFLWNRRRAKNAEKILHRSAECLQQIFEILEESSGVSRILAQESPDQELVRLKQLLKQRDQRNMVENSALKHVLAGLPDGIAALDHSQCIVFYNSEFCRLLDVSGASRTGQKLFEVLRNHTALTAAENFLNAVHEMEELEFQSVSGRILKMHLIRLPENRVVHAIIVLSDLSALKKLEAMRRDFVANVSHELRTPLTSIQGVTETLLSGAGEDPEARRRFLDLMAKDTGRLKRLIEDLLALTRLENQARDIKKEEFDPAEEISEVLELMAAQLQEKKIKIRQKTAGGRISANRDQLRQALINLLDNAVKFSPAGGEITVESKTDQDGMRISVADSGPGVQPENREKVFQRFFREDRARTRGAEGGGTGLGLAIVKHIAEAHGGSAKCEAGSDGRGSVFTLFFPRLKSQSKQRGTRQKP